MATSHFMHLNHICKYKLFKTYCMPLYGAQLWDLDCKYVDKFFVSWRKAIRRLFKLPYTTHRCLLPPLCHDQTVEQQIHQRSVSFINSISQSNNPIVSCCYKLAMSGSHSSISNNLSFLSYFYRVPRECIPSIAPEPPVVDDETSLKAVFIEELLCLLYDIDTHDIPSNDINDIISVLCTYWNFFFIRVLYVSVFFFLSLFFIVFFFSFHFFLIVWLLHVVSRIKAIELNWITCFYDYKHYLSSFQKLDC